MLDCERVEANFREAMCWFAQALPAGKVREIGDVVLVSTGLPLATFNLAMLKRRLGTDPGALERAIMIAQVFFAAEGLPWSFWLCHDLLPTSLRSRAPRLFEAGGLWAGNRFPGMIADELRACDQAPGGLSCLPVDTAARRADFCKVTAHCFGLPEETIAAIYSRPEVYEGPFAAHVGYYKGHVATTVATFRTASAVGLYSVATLPEFQGQGFAEWIIHQAVQFDRQRSGALPVVLQATASAYPLYRKMGFREVTEFTIFVGSA